MDTPHCFSHKTYGQLAFGLAAGIVQGNFLDEIHSGEGYRSTVLGIARKMEPDARPRDVSGYLYDVSPLRPIDDLRRIRIHGAHAAVACADFFLRSNKDTAETIYKNMIAIMENARLFENGELRTMTHTEVNCFIDQVYRRSALLQAH